MYLGILTFIGKYVNIGISDLANLSKSRQAYGIALVIHHKSTKGEPALIKFNEEKYVTASEVAQRLQVSYGTCKNNVLPLLTECYLPGKRRAVYRLTEVEKLSRVRTVEKQVQPLAIVKQDHEVVRLEDNLCREAL